MVGTAVALLASTARAETRADMYGFGAIRVGMSVAAAGAAASGHLRPEDEPNHDCYFVALDSDPRVHFMVLGDVIARVDLEEPGPRTMSGIQVGTSEAAVRRIFADRLRIEPHAYVSGFYLTIESKDRSHGAVFETDGHVVIHIRAGSYPAVGYIEGCS